jgi:hypothetical protein
MSSLEKCMMNAESNKDKKRCIEDDMSTVEEFIEDEELEIINGYLEIYTDGDKSNYYLKLNDDDLNSRFLYFSYVMNAPQGSSSYMGGASNRRKGIRVQEILDKIVLGLYQINTAYINWR